MRLLTILLGINAFLLLSCAEQQAESTPQPQAATSNSTTNSSSPSVTVPPDERVGAELSNNSSSISLINNDSATVILNENDSTTQTKTTGTAQKRPEQKRLSPLSYHKGVNHAHVHRRGYGYGSAPSAREHDWLTSIGGNAIAITPFGFQRGAKSNELVGVWSR